MLLSAFVSRPWQPRNVFSSGLATTRGSPLPNHLKHRPLPTISYYRQSKSNQLPVSVTPKTIERSEKVWPSIQADQETPPICSLARQPSLSGNSDPQDRQHDTDTETAVESDSDDDTAVEGDVDTDDDKLYQPWLETLHNRCPKHTIEELMKAIFVDQLVNRTRIDPWRELKRVDDLGMHRYAWKLAEDIRRQLALEVTGLSTKAILDTALNQHQTWARPLRSIEQPRIFQEDLDQADKALVECEKHHRGILSWLYLLRLLAQLEVVPNFRSFPASSGNVQEELAYVLRNCTVMTTADPVILDRELLMAAALRHRARINAGQRLGHGIDAKVNHDRLKLRARRPDLRVRWLIDETERLLGSHAPSSLGDTERMEQCRIALKLEPFARLRARYPDVKVDVKARQISWHGGKTERFTFIIVR
ncbi:hypothetical protein NCS52_01538700 [Fusarium sp. LHS14.1]|nr:hypothetical protein NCS52_01538700 [Fusarium sp. LHS14.1]